ncbi:MAG: pyridoxamine 5'-phosphate oxidase family protein [Thermoleophilia bacterium]|nr:pyridoxamine 5'-phosphate oxidase family protein [Thermoleophilia bacterium]
MGGEAGVACGGALDASPLCAIATVAPRGRAHVNAAHFACSPDFDVVWRSEPKARHSRNLRANATVAIAVFDSDQTGGEPDRGTRSIGAARTPGGSRHLAARQTWIAYAAMARVARFRRGGRG